MRLRGVQRDILRQLIFLPLTGELCLPRPEAWKKFERRALRKIQFINTAEMNLQTEIDSGNFNLKTGRFKTNPPGHIRLSIQRLQSHWKIRS